MTLRDKYGRPDTDREYGREPGQTSAQEIDEQCAKIKAANLYRKRLENQAERSSHAGIRVVKDPPRRNRPAPY